MEYALGYAAGHMLFFVLPSLVVIWLGRRHLPGAK